MFKHVCIKPGCGKTYEDSDADAYYCSDCNELRKVIAKEVDIKLAGIVSKRAKSDLQIYDEIRKARGVNFVNINDLGIRL